MRRGVACHHNCVECSKLILNKKNKTPHSAVVRVGSCDRLDQVYSFKYCWSKVIFCSSVVKTPSNKTAAESARTGLTICFGVVDPSSVHACGQLLFHCSSVKLFQWKIRLKSHLSLSLRGPSWSAGGLACGRMQPSSCIICFYRCL